MARPPETVISVQVFILHLSFERRFIPLGYSGCVIKEVWAQNELTVISPSAFFYRL